jgi:hypothetical protein
VTAAAVLPRAPQHDWAIVAPWWTWPDPTRTIGGRLTRPVIQKYETSRLVDEFIKDPQRRLKWTDEDLVHIVQTAAPIPLGSNGKPRRFSELEYVVDPLKTRKLFLDTHKRFYLVVCQIHCDAPGFPRASRGDVCEAGFVVRRRTTDIPLERMKEAGGILREIKSARSKLGVLESQASSTQTLRAVSGGGAVSPTKSVTMLVDTARTTAIVRQRESQRVLLDLERSRLRDWVDRLGLRVQLQGWFRDPSLDKIGSWQTVDEKPDALNGEAVFPMYPLIPPATNPDHSGRFGTIYFGLIPTGTGETDTLGRARFDDQQYYEITCFADRHLVPHDRGSPCNCPDQLFWSQPTDPYRLAAHFDVDGTGKRPVTVQLPDLDALAAQATPTLGVAFAKPKNSLMIKGNKSGGIASSGRTTFPEICSFSIPLITIVASFVFELFLPVVMLLFGLWFMLKLKFCIPPEISVAAGVTGELALDMSVSAEASLAVSINASIDANFGSGADIPDDPAVASALKNQFSPIATGNLEVAISTASAGGGPDLSAGVEFETEVAHP